MSSSSAPSSDASEQELLAFGKALIVLGNSELSTLAKFNKIFKEISEKMEDSEVELNPGERKLADVIFGVRSFKLLELPDVPRNQILRELGDAEIVKLSFVSQKMKRIVRSTNYSIADLEFHADHGLYESSGIDVNKSISVRFVDRPICSGDQVFKVIEGMKATWAKNEWDNRAEEDLNEDVFFIRPAGADKKILDDFLVRHFLEVFPKFDNLNVTLYSGKLKELDLWNVTRSIDSLTYYGTEDDIPVEDMQFMLEEIHVRKVLKIKSNVEDGFRYSAGFKTDVVDIVYGASWIDLDAVINSTSSQIYLGIWNDIPTNQINNLLKLWISGEHMKNLNSLTMSKCYLFGDADVFAGIEVQSHEVGSDKYIVKRSDGKLAEITLSDEEFGISLKE